MVIIVGDGYSQCECLKQTLSKMEKILFNSKKKSLIMKKK